MTGDKARDTCIAGVWAQAGMAAGDSLSEDRAKALEAIGMTWAAGMMPGGRKDTAWRGGPIRGTAIRGSHDRGCASDRWFSALCPARKRPGRDGERLALRPEKYQKGIRKELSLERIPAGYCHKGYPVTQQTAV